MEDSEKIKSNINIRDIKSLFNIIEVFSFLQEREKLNMIFYNKELQKILSVNIKDYIKICKKYKIGGRNGKGQEYDYENDDLLFEGEYLNGKRNGKVKEYYDNGELKFEGEYLNGAKNGKVKEYYESIWFEKGNKYGELEFEGEYLNGKKWNGNQYNKTPL